MTHDDKFLFSAGNDGSIGCFKFANKEQKDHSHGLSTLSLFDDIMIQIETQTRLLNEIARLQRDIEDVNQNNAAQLAADQAKNQAKEEQLRHQQQL